MKEALESELGFFPLDAKAPVVLQPRNSALDSPTTFVATQGAAVLRGASVGSVGRDEFHALQGEFLIQGIAVVGLVADDSFGQLGAEHEAKELLDQATFMRIGRSGANRQRQSLGIDQNHDFYSFAGLGAADTCATAFGFGEGSVHKTLIEPEATLLFNQAPNRTHLMVENSGLHPAQEPAVHTALGTKALRQIFPFRAVVQDPEDAGQSTAFFDWRSAAFGTDRMIGNQHFKDMELSSAECKHDHNSAALMPIMVVLG